MDSNAATKFSQRPPQQAAADNELPELAAEGSGSQRTLSGTRLRVIAVLALFSDYLRIVSQNFSDWVCRVSRVHDDDLAGDKLHLRLWRVPALLALAYAVVAALIWFIGRLERRRRQLLLQPAVDRDARWEGRAKLAAELLVHASIGGLVGYSSSMIPCAFLVFVWVKSGDQVCIKVQKEEESDEEKQYQVLM